MSRHRRRRNENHISYSSESDSDSSIEIHRSDEAYDWYRPFSVSSSESTSSTTSSGTDSSTSGSESSESSDSDDDEPIHPARNGKRHAPVEFDEDEEHNVPTKKIKSYLKHTLLLKQLNNENLMPVGTPASMLRDKMETLITKSLSRMNTRTEIDETDPLNSLSLPDEIANTIFNMALVYKHATQTYYVPLPSKNGSRLKNTLTLFQNLKNMMLVSRGWRDRMYKNFMSLFFIVLLTCTSDIFEGTHFATSCVMKRFFTHIDPFHSRSTDRGRNTRLAEGLFWWMIEEPENDFVAYSNRANFIFRFVSAIVFSVTKSEKMIAYPERRRDRHTVSAYRDKSIVRVCKGYNNQVNQIFQVYYLLDDCASTRLQVAKGLLTKGFLAKMPRVYDASDYSILLKRDPFIRRHADANEFWLSKVADVLRLCHTAPYTSLDVLLLI